PSMARTVIRVARTIRNQSGFLGLAPFFPGPFGPPGPPALAPASAVPSFFSLPEDFPGRLARRMLRAPLTGPEAAAAAGSEPAGGAAPAAAVAPAAAPAAAAGAAKLGRAPSAFSPSSPSSRRTPSPAGPERNAAVASPAPASEGVPPPSARSASTESVDS